MFFISELRVFVILFSIFFLSACNKEEKNISSNIKELMLLAEQKADSTLVICDEMLNDVQCSATSEIVASYVSSQILYSQLKYKLAAKRIKKVISSNLLVGDELVDCYCLASDIFLNNDDFESSLNVNFQLLKILHINKDQLLIAQRYIEISRIYFIDQEHDLTQYYIDKAKKINHSLNDTSLLCKILMREGTLLGEKKQYSLAISTFKKVVSLSVQSKNTNYIAKNRSNLAMCYMYSGRADSAICIFHQNIHEFQMDSSHINIVRTYRNLGYAKHLCGETDSAIFYLDKAEEMATLRQLKHLLGNINSTKAQIYKDINDHENALKFFFNYTQIKDSLLLEEKALGLSRLREEYEQDKRVLKVEAKEKQIRNWYIYGFSVIFSGLIIISILLHQNIKQRMYSAKEKSHSLEWELKCKREEIFDFVIRLREKHRIMIGIQQELQLLKKDGKNCYSHMATVLKSHLLSEDTRQLLEEKVEKGNEDYFKMVREKCPDITKDELYLIGLLKLNFSTKQIAEIFETTEKAIEGRRYRLRKKIGAAKQQNLVEFFSYNNYDKVSIKD